MMCFVRLEPGESHKNLMASSHTGISSQRNANEPMAVFIANAIRFDWRCTFSGDGLDAATDVYPIMSLHSMYNFLFDSCSFLEDRFPSYFIKYTHCFAQSLPT